jgi:lysozyme family protein
MAEFSLYAPKLLQCEGGFSWHPLDKGGATCKGVTLQTYREHYGQHKTEKDLKDIPYGEWMHIMKVGYWDRVRADEIVSQPVAEIIADWCVNSGAAGVRKAQEVIGVKPDGIVGKVTLSAINAADPEELHRRLWSARQQFFINIVKRNPSQKVFINGWMNRLNKFQYE